MGVHIMIARALSMNTCPNDQVKIALPGDLLCSDKSDNSDGSIMRENAK